MRTIKTKLKENLNSIGIVGFAYREGKVFILRAIIISIIAAVTLGIVVKKIHERNEYGYPTTKRIISIRIK